MNFLKDKGAASPSSKSQGGHNRRSSVAASDLIVSRPFILLFSNDNDMLRIRFGQVGG